MREYYLERLSGERLRQCYELAHPRLKQYLEAEIKFVLRQLESSDTVLELGCGYGRVTARLTEVAKRAVGIDNAPASIELACHLFGANSRCEFCEMDALNLAFDELTFDKVVCAQNGICAFGVDRESLFRQALRVARPGGRLVFSTYAAGFWEERLRWFETQAAAGLVGAIDYARTGNGEIVCMDGFRTGLLSPNSFQSLCCELGLKAEVTEVDGSSVFCTIVVPEVA
ncbi:MAG: class I SAM-dependent methyltransferase [Actinobacteria bacterium]|nr:class I SAM-dependent methyltransferase [Actinomycetota bacterium]